MNSISTLPTFLFTRKNLATCLVFLCFCIANSLRAQSVFSPPIETKILKDTVVYFDFGKYELRPAARTVLDSLAEEVQGLKKIRLQITAHTDAIGTNKANDLLSQNRADAVKKYLVDKGIADDIMSAEVFGENTPVADNDSETGRQQNRRATIKVLRDRPIGVYKGKVIDYKTGQGIEAEIVFRSKTVRDSFMTDKNGAFISKLPLGEIVGFDVYAPCYFFENKMFRVERRGNLEFALPKVEKGAVFPIKNLYFVGNQAELLPKSQPTLPKLLNFMKRNDCGNIEIAGHINYPNRPPVDTESWNFKLSQRRAQLVYNYLLENGISADRISWKGYGNYEMVYPNARTAEEQALNRRVEIRVIDTAPTEQSKASNN